jgi:hypothetical protein
LELNQRITGGTPAVVVFPLLKSRHYLEVQSMLAIPKLSCITCNSLYPNATERWNFELGTSNWINMVRRLDLVGPTTSSKLERRIRRNGNAVPWRFGSIRFSIWYISYQNVDRGLMSDFCDYGINNVLSINTNSEAYV